MQVVTTQPYALVFSLIEDKDLGWSIEPHVVQVNAKGQLTLTHQKVYANTLSNFPKVDIVETRKIVALLHEVGHDAIFHQFADAKSKKKIKPHDFFEKHITPEFLKKQIRPYVERRIGKVLPLLKGMNFYMKGNNDNPAHHKLEIAEGNATVLFHFKKGIEGLRYFATIKHDNKRVDFINQFSRVICQHPAFMMVDNIVYSFGEEVEGVKLTPFQTKKYIEVPQTAVDKYLRTFVVQLLEHYDVYADGFEIVNEKFVAQPIITLQQWADKYYLLLSFKYGNSDFHYHSTKKTHVKIEKENGQYIFRKIKRAGEWEQFKYQVLIDGGLENENGSLFSAGNGQLIDTITWLNANRESLRKAGFEIIQQLNRKYFLGEQTYSIDLAEGTDWFDLLVKAKFGEYEMPFHVLRDHILKGHHEFELPNGDVAVIPDEWFEKFGNIMEIAEHSDGQLRLKKYHFGLLESLWNNQENRRSHWADKLKGMVATDSEKKESLPIDFNCDLREYQEHGFQWFYYLQNNGFGGILADDMGLGKTIQSLCLLQKEKEINGVEKELVFEKTIQVPLKQGSLFEQTITEDIIIETNTKNPSAKPRKTSLIVAPTSLIYNWLSEAEKFTPGLKILVHSGQNRNRDILNKFPSYDVIITTYGTMRADDDLFKEFKFHYIILDESQAIKNPSSVTAKSIFKLRSQHKLTLTGTPVENSITDLWSQMNFVNPGLLGSFHYFNEHYVVPIEKGKDESKSQKLQLLVKPFILRRTKSMVATDLPSKTEHIRFCDMHEGQKKLYESTKSAYRNELLKSLGDRSFTKNKFSFFQGLTKLRLLANHPYMADKENTETSGKFEEVIYLAQKALSQGHKILMFSQFVKQLDIYKKHFDESETKYLYLDGSTAALDRKKLVKEFQQNDDIKLFLISLKAGGFGLNLTEADYVFLLDPWWNPAVERQAEDRSHRIGQTKNVFIYKFISRDTIEEKILGLQERKNILAQSIIQVDEGGFKQIKAEDMLELFS